MIHIERNRIDENERLIRPNDAWYSSAEEVTEKALQERDRHQIKENVYRHAQVKAALEKLFHDKCAYCECSITEGASWDVEHYRPKGRVAERRDHPGYYWLAYTWENLYPSCPFCNRKLTDQPRWDDFTVTPARGKLHQFPLEDESSRAMTPDAQIQNEKPLLLDPCHDNPEGFLGYDSLGQIYALEGNRRGESTIDLCHLTRRRLRDKRSEIINRIIEVLRIIHDLRQRDLINVCKDFERYLDKHYLADNCEFAGTARFVVGHPDLFAV